MKDPFRPPADALVFDARCRAGGGCVIAIRIDVISAPRRIETVSPPCGWPDFRVA